MVEDNDRNNQNVLMSPLLSERFNKIEEKLENISLTYNDINNKFDTILKLLIENSNRWDDNKKQYIDLLESNRNISEKNYEILNNKVNPENENNLDPRAYNRFWRTSGNNTIMKPPGVITSNPLINLPWLYTKK